MAMIHEITEQVGKYKNRKRIGRGVGSGTGKTAGRGHKGAKSRSGWGGSIHPLYEGGQTPYFQRIPKRGFSNARFRRQFAVVNIKTLEANFQDGDRVDIAALAQRHLVPNDRLPLKILGEGDLSKKLTVNASKYSASARDKIEKAGGTATLIEPVEAEPAKPAKKGGAKPQAPAEEATASEAAPDAPASEASDEKSEQA